MDTWRRYGLTFNSVFPFIVTPALVVVGGLLTGIIAANVYLKSDLLAVFRLMHASALARRRGDLKLRIRRWIGVTRD